MTLTRLLKNIVSANNSVSHKIYFKTICPLKHLHVNRMKYSSVALQPFMHSKPAAVVFILGFVIYRSERKLDTTPESQKMGQQSST